MDAITLLRSRSSISSRQLSQPGPTPEQVQTLLRLAVRVPDHGKLTPWRFLLIAGEARQRMSDLLVRTQLQNQPNIDPVALEKDRMRFLYAPLIVTVISCLTPDHKIPECEQTLSAGAVCMQLLNAAHAMGFGAQWLTAWPAYDLEVMDALQLQQNEHIAGFIHIGSISAAPVERSRPEIESLLQYW
jgi:nitroreductase